MLDYTFSYAEVLERDFRTHLLLDRVTSKHTHAHAHAPSLASEGRSSPSNLGSLIRLYTNSIGNINISLRSQCHFLYFRYVFVGLQASLVVPLSSATSTGWNKLYTLGGGGGALNNRFRADRGSLDPFVLSFFSIPSLNFCGQGKNLFTFPISKFDTFI